MKRAHDDPLPIDIVNTSKEDHVGRNYGLEHARAFSRNTILKKLDLRHNRLGDEGAKALALNTTLIELDLSENGIGDEGAKALALNTLLKVLTLNRNDIRDEGADALGSAPLRVLDLAENLIRDPGQLGRTLTLETLNLSYNKINDEGARRFLRMNTLRALNLHSNHIDPEILEEIKTNLGSETRWQRLEEQREREKQLQYSKGRKDFVYQLLVIAMAAPWEMLPVELIDKIVTLIFNDDHFHQWCFRTDKVMRQICCFATFILTNKSIIMEHIKANLLLIIIETGTLHAPEFAFGSRFMT